MIKYFENISAKPPVDHILYRMGYKKGLTSLSHDEMNRINEGIAKAKRLCVLKGAYASFKITEKNSNFIKLENGVTFISSKLAALLSGSDELYLMAGTAGKDVVDAASREVTAGNAAFGVIIDATASEMTDSILDFLQSFIDKQLERHGKKLTVRFSPGYGDLELSAQKIIYETLKLEKIGIFINDRHILIPEKSVMAISGVRPA